MLSVYTEIYTDDVRVVPSFDRADISPVCEWLMMVQFSQTAQDCSLAYIHDTRLVLEVACMHDNPGGM